MSSVPNCEEKPFLAIIDSEERLTTNDSRPRTVIEPPASNHPRRISGRPDVVPRACLTMCIAHEIGP
jgi:hypothetical protein